MIKIVVFAVVAVALISGCWLMPDPNHSFEFINSSSYTVIVTPNGQTHKKGLIEVRMNKTATTFILLVILIAGPVFATQSRIASQSYQPDPMKTTGIVLGGASLLEISSSESYEKGRNDAELLHSSTGWAIGGVICGGVASLLGTGLIALIARTT